MRIAQRAYSFEWRWIGRGLSTDDLARNLNIPLHFRESEGATHQLLRASSPPVPLYGPLPQEEQTWLLWDLEWKATKAKHTTNPNLQVGSYGLAHIGSPGFSKRDWWHTHHKVSHRAIIVAVVKGCDWKSTFRRKCCYRLFKVLLQGKVLDLLHRRLFWLW